MFPPLRLSPTLPLGHGPTKIELKFPEGRLIDVHSATPLLCEATVDKRARRPTTELVGPNIPRSWNVLQPYVVATAPAQERKFTQDPQ